MIGDVVDVVRRFNGKRDISSLIECVPIDCVDEI